VPDTNTAASQTQGGKRSLRTRHTAGHPALSRGLLITSNITSTSTVFFLDVQK
jgi:hypothetical protein